MICPKCRRETTVIMTPQFICADCLLVEQRKKIELLSERIASLERELNEAKEPTPS
jgi:BMFP domain-containing protein YqiC